jgi:hypothetical protein
MKKVKCCHTSQPKKRIEEEILAAAVKEAASMFAVAGKKARWKL